MPETIRTANERLRSRPRRGGLLAAFATVTSLIALATPARADAGPILAAVQAGLTGQEIASLTLTVGLIGFAVLATIMLVRARRPGRNGTISRDEATALHAEIDRLKTLLLAEPQIMVAWAAGSDEPEILGDTALIASGAVAERVLAFGTWLDATAAQHMEQAVEMLRSQGHGFVLNLTTRGGGPPGAAWG